MNLPCSLCEGSYIGLSEKALFVMIIVRMCLFICIKDLLFVILKVVDFFFLSYTNLFLLWLRALFQKGWEIGLQTTTGNLETSQQTWLLQYAKGEIFRFVICYACK